MKKNTFVSVIVPTYNRKENLKKCLEALKKIDYPKKSYEAIIINDGGEDGTDEFMKKFIKENKGFKYLKQKNSGPAKARNNGVKNSKGEIIVFIDDDIIVPKNLIEKHLKYYKNKKIGGVGGNQLPKKLSWPDLYYIARYLDEFLKVQKWLDPNSGKGLATANCSYRAKILKELKGFDESFPLAAGEDIDLSRRVMERGWTLVKDPTIVTEHLRSETFRSVVKLKFKRMSGAVIDNKRKAKKEKIYKFSRVINQWKNFRIAKKKFLNMEVNLFDFLKFVYLTLALFISSVMGVRHFSKSLGTKK